MKLNIYEYAYLVIYALVCIGIGFWSSRSNKASDYLIAGRKQNLYLGLIGFLDAGKTE